MAEGQVCKQVGFIVKGPIRYYINHDREEKTYAFAQENNFVWNYESFLRQTPSDKFSFIIASKRINSSLKCSIINPSWVQLPFSLAVVGVPAGASSSKYYTDTNNMHGDTVSGYKIRLIGLVVAVIIVNDKSPLEQQQRRLRNSLHLAVRRTTAYTPHWLKCSNFAGTHEPV